MTDALKFYESLTTPDSEDWVMIVDEEQTYLAEIQEISGTGYSRVIRVKTDDVFDVIRNLPADHPLGCVNLILPTDADERGVQEMRTFLSEFAAKKGFSFIETVGFVPTAEAIEALSEMGITQH